MAAEVELQKGAALGRIEGEKGGGGGWGSGGGGEGEEGDVSGLGECEGGQSQRGSFADAEGAEEGGGDEDNGGGGRVEVGDADVDDVLSVLHGLVLPLGLLCLAPLRSRDGEREGEGHLGVDDGLQRVGGEDELPLAVGLVAAQRVEGEGHATTRLFFLQLPLLPLGLQSLLLLPPPPLPLHLLDGVLALTLGALLLLLFAQLLLHPQPRLALSLSLLLPSVLLCFLRSEGRVQSAEFGRVVNAGADDRDAHGGWEGERGEGRRGRRDFASDEADEFESGREVEEEGDVGVQLGDGGGQRERERLGGRAVLGRHLHGVAAVGRRGRHGWREARAVCRLELKNAGHLSSVFVSGERRLKERRGGERRGEGQERRGQRRGGPSSVFTAAV